MSHGVRGPMLDTDKADRPRHSPYLHCHSTLATALYLVDVLMNSAIEFGDLSGQRDELTDNTVLSIAQVLLQVLALVNLLSLLGTTFLFRSGLFGVLYHEFRLVLLALPAYTALTTLLAGIRLHYLGAGVTLDGLWAIGGYHALSSLHKLSALVYYFSGVRAVEQLRDAKFYSHKHWMVTTARLRARTASP